MLTGVFGVTTGTYEKLIENNCRNRGNLMVFGQAGIGKTEIPFQIFKKLGIPTVYWNLSTQEAPDLVGLPIIKEEGGAEVVRYAAPEYMPIKERTSQPVAVVIDEIDKAKPELQNPLLEIFQGARNGTHTINGRPLNIQCIVATANLPEENAFSKPVSHPLTNRSQIFQLKHNFDEWQQWAVNAGVNPLVVGFLSKNSEYLSRPPVEGDPTAYTRCSPRSWTWAGYDLSSSPDESIDFQTLMVAGRVGQEPAAKFRVWLDHYRIIQPLIDQLVKKGEIPNLDSCTIDRILVMAIGACSAISNLSRKETKSNSEKDKLVVEVQKTATNVFKFLKKLPAEFQVGSIKSALSLAIIQENKLTTIPDVMAVYMNVRSALSS
jgi:hypothetical protein